MANLSLTVFHTYLGWMGIESSSKGLRRLILPQQSKESVLDQAGDSCSVLDDGDSAFLVDLSERLQSYLEGEPVDFPDKLDLSGASRFQRGVWEVTQSIPYGQTRSYGWVAERLGKPQAMRAVGQVLGRNPLPIIIPCHRVLRADGGLGGFSGGLEMKKLLLRLEKARRET